MAGVRLGERESARRGERQGKGPGNNSSAMHVLILEVTSHATIAMARPVARANTIRPGQRAVSRIRSFVEAGRGLATWPGIPADDMAGIALPSHRVLPAQ